MTEDCFAHGPAKDDRDQLIDTLRQQLAAAIAERDRAVKDAERYREARLHVKAADVRNRIGRCDETRHADYLATVDATIDAAIAAIAAGGEGVA